MNKDDQMLEQTSKFLETLQPFIKLMAEYRCAMLEIQTKFEVLNTELSLEQERNPIENIIGRIKQPMSIIEKMKRYGLEPTVENIEKNMHDVAGIRVICSFPKDIYLLADKICSHDDIRLVEKKDYIKHPKPSGYRSLHLILEVPVFLSEEKKWMKVEVQLRTIAMDFWASIEHKVRYKKDIVETEEIVQELKQCAESIHEMDMRMQKISQQIEKQAKENQ